VAAAEAVGRELDATVVNMRFIKPLDEELIVELADACALLVTVEEHVTAAGAGSAVSETLRRRARPVELLNLGLPDKHLSHGSQTEQLAACNLDTPGIKRSIQTKLESMTRDSRNTIDQRISQNLSA